MELDFTGAPVVVFRHAGIGRVNMVYRRSDGNIGWIDPSVGASDGLNPRGPRATVGSVHPRAWRARCTILAIAEAAKRNANAAFRFSHTRARIPALKANSKKQALQELAEHGCPAPASRMREIFETLLQRERLGSTGIGHGIAIPTASSPRSRAVRRVRRLERPIDFEALDGEPVDLIFLLIAPESARRRPSEGAGPRRPRACATQRHAKAAGGPIRGCDLRHADRDAVLAHGRLRRLRDAAGALQAPEAPRSQTVDPVGRHGGHARAERPSSSTTRRVPIRRGEPRPAPWPRRSARNSLASISASDRGRIPPASVTPPVARKYGHIARKSAPRAHKAAAGVGLVAGRHPAERALHDRRAVERALGSPAQRRGRGGQRASPGPEMTRSRPSPVPCTRPDRARTPCSSSSSGPNRYGRLRWARARIAPVSVSKRGDAEACPGPSTTRGPDPAPTAGPIWCRNRFGMAGRASACASKSLSSRPCSTRPSRRTRARR